MTTHDPNHALLRATKVAAIDREGGFVVGRPSDIVTEDYLRRTYQVDARIIEAPLDESSTVRLCLPLGRPVLEEIAP